MKIVVASVIGSLMACAAFGPAQAGIVGNAYDKWTIYSPKTVACIETDAGKLTAGQQAYLEAILDDKFLNEPAARAKAGLGIADLVKVHGFIWTAGPNCVLKS